MLEGEAIVIRLRGAVSGVDSQDALRRWTEDYEQMDSITPTTALEPQRLSTLETKLRATTFAAAATGAFAAQRFDPIAPATLEAIYVTDAPQSTRCLGLRELKLPPRGASRAPGFRRLRPPGRPRRPPLRRSSQLALDLITGPGRGTITL